jgi:hypothetical protein
MPAPGPGQGRRTQYSVSRERTSKVK